MISKIFSVYDSKAEVFSPPFFAQTKGLALRSFTDLAQDPQTSVNKYPADFTLFELGEFDDNTGHVTSHKTPLSMGLAQEFLRPETQSAA